jgi:L,D-peptidoglycan transpeptidase YkuD (ErfK/YbiS/YcfS/YnhG family)
LVRFRTRALVGAALISLVGPIGLTGCASVRAGHGAALKPRPSSSPPPTSTSPRATHTTPRPPTSPHRTHAAPSSTHVAPPPPPPPAPAPAVRTGLPLAFSTGTATRVITVVAPSTSSTTATLQAWQKSGSGWARHGAAIPAHVGSQGLTTHSSESLSATPIGSFTLTQAFGALGNPGTQLPYLRTDSADWWISQPGPLYNTHQHCASGCAFAQGSPNEHLVYETPYYNYAVVIDVNMHPTVQGAGSAFFLHVTDGNPTDGCVSIPQADLVAIMQWLTPAAHPRMLIGISG